MIRQTKSRRPSCRHRWTIIGWHFVPGHGTDTTRYRRECARCGDVSVMPVRGEIVIERIADRDRTERSMRAADAERIQRGEPIDERTLPQKGER